MTFYGNANIASNYKTNEIDCIVGTLLQLTKIDKKKNTRLKIYAKQNEIRAKSIFE